MTQQTTTTETIAHKGAKYSVTTANDGVQRHVTVHQGGKVFGTILTSKWTKNVSAFLPGAQVAGKALTSTGLTSTGVILKTTLINQLAIWLIDQAPAAELAQQAEQVQVEVQAVAYLVEFKDGVAVTVSKRDVALGWIKIWIMGTNAHDELMTRVLQAIRRAEYVRTMNAETNRIALKHFGRGADAVMLAALAEAYAAGKAAQ